MWLTLLGLIPDAFKTVNGITSAIANERLKKIQATTDQEKIAADERIQHLEAIRDVRMSKVENPLTALMMFGYGVGPLVILTKIYVWDKTIGSLMGCAGEAGQAASCATFRTDPLDPNLWWVITAQIAFYFLAKTLK
jgi:hypothetical protein